ncbi:flavin reductase [Phytohabitans sp. ZYX-F-186]|uniref:Flavin reductase n=1 Tax=Phytohabitans maris TaxID=3071409 RepID=A0ABU0ZUV6_9ACTN|nr:flavin reductase [Phytohabitans sp. ZYX-F-186]MDQ7910767.1 flavin reductase [Phytohabitans sp. ZYX-F-186]
MSEQHVPRRPEWTCQVCGQEWPCPPARTMLAEEHVRDRVSLGVYMAVQLGHAAGELNCASSSELYRRFVEWTRP